MSSTENLKCHSQENEKYTSIDDVRCPICDGVINSKWFDCVSNDYAFFTAECWSGDINDQYNDEHKPKHIFTFAIKTPERMMISNKENENED